LRPTLNLRTSSLYLCPPVTGTGFSFLGLVRLRWRHKEIINSNFNT
jgi:hypothetical protein